MTEKQLDRIREQKRLYNLPEHRKLQMEKRVIEEFRRRQRDWERYVFRGDFRNYD
mgnify:CR=1 FL=1